MDANGGSMGRRWPRVTHAPELTTDAQWPQDAPSGSRFAILSPCMMVAICVFKLLKKHYPYNYI
jgi:hypothetical protein